jgi:hypothetical protein
VVANAATSFETKASPGPRRTSIYGELNTQTKAAAAVICALLQSSASQLSKVS